jgi:membrane fusion protein, copper/silver efflux system
MPRIAVGALGVAVALGAGYWLGQSTRLPATVATVATVATGIHSAAAPPGAAAAQRAILYYKDPTGKPDFSPEPKKDTEGRDYVPVYAEEEAAAVPAPATPPPAPHDKGKILYYRNPMGLPDTSPVPKKDPMGMDYVPVYEGDDDSGGATFKISLDKVQKLGVRTAPVEARQLTHTVHAVGTVQVDERRQTIVAPKFEGYVEVLHADTTGQSLRRGQPLMEIYSPDLVLAQQEYLAAWKGLQALDSAASAEAREAARTLVDGALQRLRNWDIPASELAKLKNRGTVSRTLALVAPAGGVVLEKNVVSGQRFMPGDVLYRIADLSTVWVIADVYEQELPFVRLGQDAKVTFNALPGQTFAGKVTFIYPTLSADTRTAKIRIELPNRDDQLKPAFYGSVDIAAAAGKKEMLAVPDSALLDTGTRKIVLIDRGEGRFEPREVKTGSRADGYVEVIDGVSQGDSVVVSANFLIDAESNLRAALQGFKSN